VTCHGVVRVILGCQRRGERAAAGVPWRFGVAALQRLHGGVAGASATGRESAGGCGRAAAFFGGATFAWRRGGRAAVGGSGSADSTGTQKNEGPGACASGPRLQPAGGCSVDYMPESVRISMTRRFSWRPSSVALSAIGLASPWPIELRRAGSTPREVR